MYFYNLEYNEETGAQKESDSISIENDFYFCLSYHTLSIPPLESFRYGFNCTLIRCSMRNNYVSYLKNKDTYQNKIVKDQENHPYKLECRPKYCSIMIIFSPLRRHFSFRTYKLLLEELCLPFLSLFRKRTQGTLDWMKAAKLL